MPCSKTTAAACTRQQFHHHVLLPALAVVLLAALLLFGRTADSLDNAKRAEDDAIGSCTQPLALDVDEGPCTIERVKLDDLTADEFEARFKEKQPVIVVTGMPYNQRLREAVERDSLLAEYGDMIVSLGTAESYTGRTSLQVPFRRYINEMITQPQTLESLGNETYYLFGSAQGKRFPELLKAYRLPPFDAAVQEGQYSTLSFGLAGKNSGVPFHGHGPGWSEVLHGRKRWFLYPRDDARTPSEIVHFDPDASQLQWLSSVYPTLQPSDRPIQCTIKPGEILYFPTWWVHAVLNLDPYTSFVSTFQ